MKLTPAEIISSLNEMCDAAAEPTLRLFRNSLVVENKLKEDFDPVTKADKEAELAIRTIIDNKYADHGIIGEEFGQKNNTAEYQWIIDPIDGTRAYISGIPLWGTLVGLYHNNIPLAGMMSQPFTKERYWCVPNESGSSAKMSIADDAPASLSTRQHSQLSQCTLMTTTPALFSDSERQKFDRLEAQTQLSRYGTDCYAYCLLAAGHADLVVESGLSIYDIAALIPIIQGAGGVVTNWEGGDASQGGQILAAANPAIHRQALSILRD